MATCVVTASILYCASFVKLDTSALSEYETKQALYAKDAMWFLKNPRPRLIGLGRMRLRRIRLNQIWVSRRYYIILKLI